MVGIQWAFNYWLVLDACLQKNEWRISVCFLYGFVDLFVYWELYAGWGARVGEREWGKQGMGLLFLRCYDRSAEISDKP